MAKKSRRTRRRARTAAQPVRITQPAAKLASAQTSKEVDFAEEYHYVIEDLKRIAITAVALLVLLIVLALLLS
ncbi:MAG: hypothetical protein PVH95_00390 [Anaerolineae bacterium]|jgi:hypothetical protein